MSILLMTLSGLEAGPWAQQSGPSINPVTADWGDAQSLSDGSFVLSIWSSKPYGARLWNQVNKLLFKSTSVVSSYSFKVTATTKLYGQVIETDTKFTDDAGWTYPGDFQWNIGEGWAAQSGNPWFDLGIKMPEPVNGQEVKVSIHRIIDYKAHIITTTQVDVDGINYKPTTLIAIPAKQMSPVWASMEIVDQLQMCTNRLVGGYSVGFNYMGHVLS